MQPLQHESTLQRPCIPGGIIFRMSTRTLILSILGVALITAGFYLYRTTHATGLRAAQVFAWIRNPGSDRGLVTSAGSRCGSAPFIFPTTGVAGFLWDDSFQLGHRHQGVDIFAGTDINVTAVIAAYPGYLTRLPEWKSSVIVRVPSDPLQPGRQIWVYYTHMADPSGNSFISPDFPPGTYERPVEAGTVLGRQGDYSGDPNNPVGVHLHISIVKDNAGKFLNELDINNTYDPSPYFGMPLNARENPDSVPVCPAAATDQ
jgi:peptidoglycan LD-endopeptidase LytH